jgi:hypothetical protein
MDIGAKGFDLHNIWRVTGVVDREEVNLMPKRYVFDQMKTSDFAAVIWWIWDIRRQKSDPHRAFSLA